MVHVLDWSAISAVLPHIDCADAMRAAFRSYSRGHAVIPQLGELNFSQPPGDGHIKYRYLQAGVNDVVKIASVFYENPDKGLPSSQVVMLLFSHTTGQLGCRLCDDGRLTDERTGAAGAVVAECMPPSHVKAVVILGAGIQARMQLKYLRTAIPCRELNVWSRHDTRQRTFANEARDNGWTVHEAPSVEAVVRASNFIVTTTPAHSPLIKSAWVSKGTHMTAFGADPPEKQELEESLIQKADLVVVDSVSQRRQRGEVHHALKRNLF